MTEPFPLDRIRDLLDGRLAPADVEALRAEIAADPALRADFDAFREVHALTSCELPVAPPRLTADRILAADAPATPVLRLRPWMAAAALLVAVATGVAASLARGRPREVALGALDVPHAVVSVTTRSGVADAAAPSVPAELADYAPVRDGAPQWISSWDEGAALARASSRPILAYVYYDGCPYCNELDAKTFADAGVQADLAEFVPVRLDVTKLAEGDPLLERLPKGWPYVAALRPDGSEIHGLAGRWELEDVAPEMHRAVEAARRAEPSQPSWDAVRSAAKSVLAAESALAAGRAGEAWNDAVLAGSAVPRSGIATRAEKVRSDVRARAQRVLDEVAAARGAGAGRADRLERAARDFAGSPFGDDFAAVARAVRETGVFPVLTHPGENR